MGRSLPTSSRSGGSETRRSGGSETRRSSGGETRLPPHRAQNARWGPRLMPAGERAGVERAMVGDAPQPKMARFDASWRIHIQRRFEQRGDSLVFRVATVVVDQEEYRIGER